MERKRLSENEASPLGRSQGYLDEVQQPFAWNQPLQQELIIDLEARLREELEDLEFRIYKLEQAQKYPKKQ